MTRLLGSVRLGPAPFHHGLFPNTAGVIESLTSNFIAVCSAPLAFPRVSSTLISFMRHLRPRRLLTIPLRATGWRRLGPPSGPSILALEREGRRRNSGSRIDSSYCSEIKVSFLADASADFGM